MTLLREALPRDAAWSTVAAAAWRGSRPGTLEDRGGAKPSSMTSSCRQYTPSSRASTSAAASSFVARPQPSTRRTRSVAHAARAPTSPMHAAAPIVALPDSIRWVKHAADGRPPSRAPPSRRESTRAAAPSAPTELLRRIRDAPRRRGRVVGGSAARRAAARSAPLRAPSLRGRRSCRLSTARRARCEAPPRAPRRQRRRRCPTARSP